MQNTRHIFLSLLFLIFSLAAFAQCTSGDCKNGTGIYMYPSGAKYVGEFKNGEIHGVGSCYYTDGSVYRGNWKNRYPEGEGTKTYGDGTVRSGLWLKGFPVDQNGNVQEELIARTGTISANLDIQTGCLQGNCKTGEGVYAYADGSKYEGAFTSGKIDGNGMFFFPNGDKYVGGFRDGYSHGQGVLYHVDGTSTKGEWRRGEFVNDITTNFGQVGCVQGDCENGNGTYVYQNGEAKYQGDFQNNVPHGSGRIVYTNGESYNGQWQNGSFNGEGTLFLRDGNEVTGLWQNGTYQGTATRAEPQLENNPNIDEKLLEDTDAILAAADTKVWAVVIGVASYLDMPALRYTDDDAYRMYAFLKSPEGGALPENQVQILVDEAATKNNIVNAMRRIYGQAGENDLVLMYFSGHGIQGSFLPIDFDGYNNQLLHDEINQILEESPAKYKLCIADACHSGGLLQMKSGSVNNTLKNYYKSLAQAMPGTALIMSSKSEETSLESNNLRQGVFSHFLLRGLKGEADFDNNAIVSVKELYDFIGDNVRSYTNYRQSPVIMGDYDERMTVAALRK